MNNLCFTLYIILSNKMKSHGDVHIVLLESHLFSKYVHSVCVHTCLLVFSSNLNRCSSIWLLNVKWPYFYLVMLQITTILLFANQIYQNQGLTCCNCKGKNIKIKTIKGERIYITFIVLYHHYHSNFLVSCYA